MLTMKQQTRTDAIAKLKSVVAAMKADHSLITAATHVAYAPGCILQQANEPSDTPATCVFGDTGFRSCLPSILCVPLSLTPSEAEIIAALYDTARSYRLHATGDPLRVSSTLGKLSNYIDNLPAEMPADEMPHGTLIDALGALHNP